MSFDQYVIVYRDGSCGPAQSFRDSEMDLRDYWPSRRPAYRIRIREKPQQFMRGPKLSGREARQALARGDRQAYIDGLRDYRP